jgi:hypothetical protein
MVSMEGVVAMKQAHLLVKIAVLLNFVVLVGGCVGYRAGVFDWFGGRAASSSERGPSQQDSAGAAPQAPVLMPGSKIGIQFREVTLPDGRVIEEAEPLPGTSSPSAQRSAKSAPPRADETGSLMFMVGPKSDAGMTGSIILNEITKETSQPPANPQPPAPSK